MASRLCAMPQGRGDLPVNRRWWVTGVVALILADLAIITWVLSRGNSNLTLWVFVFALGAMVPLATLIGAATERLVPFLGDVSSGLVDATLSNVPELAIGVFLLIQARSFASSPAMVTTDFDVIRGLLVGSVINNILLTLGIAVFFGALRHGRLKFDASRAAGYASMLALAVVGLALPNLASAFATARTAADEQHAEVIVSVLVCVILMMTYVVYIGTEIFGWGEKAAPALATAGEDGHEAATVEHEQHKATGREEHEESHGESREHIAEHKLLRELEEAEERLREATERDKHLQMRKQFPRRFQLAIVGLAAVSVVTVVMAALLVNVTDQVIVNTPLTPLSVGLIIFPIVCNLGEAGGALQSAWHRNMETAMSVAAGSSVQIPLFVTPLLVFISLAIAATGGSVLTLHFLPAELIVVALVAFMYALVNLDGETTWLEGLQLLALYAMVAITAFVLPGR